METRDFIATSVVDRSSSLYYFSNFSHDDDIDSSTHFDHTCSINTNIEEKFGLLNLGIISCDQVLYPYIYYNPIETISNIVPDDAFIHTTMDLGDSLYQNTHYLQTQFHKMTIW